MSVIRLFPALVLSMLVFAACAGQPAPAAVDTAPAVEETMGRDAAAEMADDNDANTEEMHTEEMGSEAMEAEGMDDDVSSGEMSDSDMMESESMDSDATDDDTMDSDAAMDTEMPAESMEEPMTDAVERPSWQQITLTDARTSQEFTLADYDGSPVFVEAFATWCGNCRKQLGNVQEAYAQLGEEALFIALSVEPNIANEALVDYADKQGFQFTFAAMPPEMLQQLAAEYGQTISNPPATPHFIIRPDGSVTDLVTGFEDAGELVEQIEAASS